MLRVDVGVFAHNEAAGIAAMVAELVRQTWQGIDARIVILCNGCTDDTARRALSAGGVEVVDLSQGGKSRTWNRFVHDLSRRDADILIMADADIQMPEADSLSALAITLAAFENLHVVNSRPVKDIVHRPEGLSLLDRIIAAAGGGLDDWRTAICGQLYAIRADVARRYHLPIGLPVEDGFLRAMVLTDALTTDGDVGLIEGADVFHIYSSERSIPALIRHQTRIVIGSAINAAAFADLRSLAPQLRHAALAQAAGDDGWLAAMLARQLPRLPFGYVPVHFLTKRLSRMTLRRLPITLAGFFFDAIVYAIAQIRMARGVGAGFW